MVTHRFDLKFRVKVSYDKEDEIWYADCIDLQGCHTIGDSRDEAVDNLVEVVKDRVMAGMEFVGRGTGKGPSHEMHVRASSELIEICA